jgi:dipeptidase, putative
LLEKTLDSMKDELVAAIQEVVRIKSVGGEPAEGAPYGEGPRKCLDWTLAFAEQMGFRTKNVDNVAGWAEMGEGDEMVALLGHLDVVPEGKGWTVDPWGGELKDGMVWGRGVLDNKGPVIIGLFAAKAIFDAGLKLKRRVRVIFGTNEEQGSKSMKRYAELGEDLPAAGFTPDAEYPIIHAEKGIVTYTVSLSLRPVGRNEDNLPRGRRGRQCGHGRGYGRDRGLQDRVQAAHHRRRVRLEGAGRQFPFLRR